MKPSARRGAIWHLEWLDSDLPPGVLFPLGVNHWLREPLFSDEHPLFPSDDGSTWLDCHYTMRAHREAARPVERQPMPSRLIRCIRAAYRRVTPERIADWYFALSRLKEPDVLAFIHAEASSDTTLRKAGDLIATRRTGSPASMSVPAGRRGRRAASTRNAYMFAALAALKERYGVAIRYENKAGRARDDGCAAVAPVFNVEARRLRRIWDKLPKHERDRIRCCYKRYGRIGAYLHVGRRVFAAHRPGRVMRARSDGISPG